MINSQEANRILTGLIFLGTKAERLLVAKRDPRVADREVFDWAIRRLQATCSEAVMHGPETLTRSAGHSTVEDLLARSLVLLFSAAHANNMQLASAILRELNRLQDEENKNALDKSL